MSRHAAPLAGVVAILVIVIGCSTNVTITNPPTISPPPTATPSPSPTATPSPSPTAPPSPSPTATPGSDPTPPPDPTPIPWEEIETELVMLELRPVNLPVEDDEMGDGRNADGSEPREISPDLDLRRAFGGWAPIDQTHFGKGGFFDCANPMVWCGNNPVPIGGNKLVLVGLQTYGDIDTQVQRDGQLAVCFNRLGAPNAPDDSGSFGGCDLVLIANLGGNDLFELVYNGQFQSRDTVGRMHLDGDTALFVMPLGMDEEPDYRVVTFERVPPQTPGGERTDTLPYSFFDVFFEIQPAN